MLSFCFENLYTDMSRAIGNSDWAINSAADNFINGFDHPFNARSQEPYHVPSEMAKEFYNGLGKNFGYAQHGSLENPFEDNLSKSMDRNLPLFVTDKEADDYVKHGDSLDRYIESHPEYNGPTPAKVPLSYRNQPPKETAEPGGWGGI